DLNDGVLRGDPDVVAGDLEGGVGELADAPAGDGDVGQGGLGGEHDGHVGDGAGELGGQFRIDGDVAAGGQGDGFGTGALDRAALGLEGDVDVDDGVAGGDEHDLHAHVFAGGPLGGQLFAEVLGIPPGHAGGAAALRGQVDGDHAAAFVFAHLGFDASLRGEAAAALRGHDERADGVDGLFGAQGGRGEGERQGEGGPGG